MSEKQKHYGEKQPAEKEAAWKRAQRGVEAERCARCGATTNLRRHHTGKGDAVQVLCQRCHESTYPNGPGKAG
jgi:ribosomal protein S27AE